MVVIEEIANEEKAKIIRKIKIQNKGKKKKGDTRGQGYNDSKIRFNAIIIIKNIVIIISNLQNQEKYLRSSWEVQS